ncbi:MAG: hypothetical protein J5599_07810 [Spirochaetales bacterium]|nr:hypothetical protein [Spirochaetales bacterium]
MRKAVAIILMLSVCLCAFAVTAQGGMNLSECRDTRVVSFINYINDQGVLTSEFDYYAINIDEEDDYFVVFHPADSDLSEGLFVYFEQYMIEFFWYSDTYITDETLLDTLWAINDFSEQYANWATLSVDTFDGCLKASSVMSTEGIASYGVAVYDNLEMFIYLAEEGFSYVQEMIEGEK